MCGPIRAHRIITPSFQKSFITVMRQTLTEEPAINTAARNAQLDIFPKSNERHNWARIWARIRRLPLIDLNTLLHIFSAESGSLYWPWVDYIWSTSWWPRCAPHWPQGPRWWGQSRSDAPHVLRRSWASVQRWRPDAPRCCGSPAVDAASPAPCRPGSCAESTRRLAAPAWSAPRDPATPGRCTPSPGDKPCARRPLRPSRPPSPTRKVGLHIYICVSPLPEKSSLSHLTEQPRTFTVTFTNIRPISVSRPGRARAWDGQHSHRLGPRLQPLPPRPQQALRPAGCRRRAGEHEGQSGRDPEETGGAGQSRTHRSKPRVCSVPPKVFWGRFGGRAGAPQGGARALFEEL